MSEVNGCSRRRSRLVVVDRCRGARRLSSSGSRTNGNNLDRTIGTSARSSGRGSISGSSVSIDSSRRSVPSTLSNGGASNTGAASSYTCTVKANSIDSKLDRVKGAVRCKLKLHGSGAATLLIGDSGHVLVERAGLVASRAIGHVVDDIQSGVFLGGQGQGVDGKTIAGRRGEAGSRATRLGNSSENPFGLE